MIYLDAKQAIPAEHLAEYEKQLNKEFEETQLVKLQKQYGVGSSRELDLKLHAVGTSIEREKLARSASSNWLNSGEYCKSNARKIPPTTKWPPIIASIKTSLRSRLA